MFTSSAMCCSKILFFFFFSCIVRIRLNQSQLCLLLATKRTLADLLTMFTSIIQSEKVMADRSHANDICPDWHGLTRSYTWRRYAFQLIFNGKRLSLARRPSLLQKNVECRGGGGGHVGEGGCSSVAAKRLFAARLRSETRRVVHEYIMRKGLGWTALWRRIICMQIGASVLKTRH